jgi:phosphoesterase RecJ-like protein
MHAVSSNTKVLDDQTIDALCIFDSSRPEALRPALDLPSRRAPRLVFDHHASNPHFGDINAIDVDASATCEVLYDFFLTNAIPLTRDMAACLLMGMVTDTASLTAGNTNARMLKKTAHLMKIGGHVHTVVREVVQSAHVPRLKLWGRVLERCVEHPTFGCATTYVRQADLAECGANKEDLDDMSDYLARTLKTPIIVFLKELPRGEGVKVSLRSHGPSVLALAKAFGGGGHEQACGFTVPGRLEETPRGVVIV